MNDVKKNGVGLNFILSGIMLKMFKYTLQILRCLHCKILKVCLAIFQHYAGKGSPILYNVPLHISNILQD